jgi:hypothetical protein
MQKRIVVVLAFGAGLIAASGAPAASAKPDGFNGVWSVHLVTEAGSCEPSYSYAVAVENGRLRPTGDASTTISGQVGANGAVNLDIRRGLARADASGRLQANAGSGTWRVAVVGCSGRWTAQRRATTADRSQ